VNQVAGDQRSGGGDGGSSGGGGVGINKRRPMEQ